MAAKAGVPADSNAVLIGVSDYYHSDEFPPIRAARNSLQAMRAMLADPALCGWPPGQVTVIENPDSAADLADQVADLAESTTGVLLLYYVGHGVLSARGELCLTVTSTRPNRPKYSGLAWENLAEVLRACPARARLVILDCCFAGQAIEALGGDSDPGLADIAHVQGVYTLTATTRNRTAHVPRQQDTACTSFTGELLDLIRSGIPGKPAWLTLGDIYPALRQRLRAKALPAPNQRGTDTAYQFPFTANAAAGQRAAEARSRNDDAAAGDSSAADPGTTRASRERIRAFLQESAEVPGYVAGTWAIDPVHSEVSFVVWHMMVGKVRGRFDNFEGTFVTGDDPLASTVTASVDLTSITTGQEQRDAHIRSADFFEVKRYPSMTFTSTAIKAGEEGFILEGDLTIKDVTKSVAFNLEINGFGPDAYGGTRAGFSATTQINRHDFNVDFNGPIPGVPGGVAVSENVIITLEIEGVLQA